MALVGSNTTNNIRKNVDDESCSWFNNNKSNNIDKVSKRGISGLSVLNKETDIVNFKTSELKKNKGLLKDHLDKVLGSVNSDITKDLLSSLNEKVVGTVDMDNIIKENVIDKITSTLNHPGATLKTKSIFSKTLSLICDKNGLNFDLDLSILLKGLNLDALLDLLNCMSDDRTIAGRVSHMLDLDTSNVIKNKTLNNVMSKHTISAKSGLSILGKKSVKKGLKNKIINVDNFTTKTKVNRKHISREDKQRYLDILDRNTDIDTYKRSHSTDVNTTLDKLITDVKNSKSKQKTITPISNDTKIYLKSRLVR